MVDFLEPRGPLDAVVVGAGHNGLVAAAYLARAGLGVEVFERRDVVGGACVTEELWAGVRADPGAYALSLLRPEIVRDLELRSHGLRLEIHEPALFAPFPDGRGVIIWSSRERTREGLARDHRRGDADAYAGWARRREAAAGRARALMLRPADRERWLAALGPGLLEGSIAQDLREIPSPEVRVPLAMQGLIGTLAGPEDPGTAFVSLYHDLGGAAGTPGAWAYPRGGMGSVTAALRSAAEAAGAGVHVGAPVERVMVRDGRAAGVVLESGREVEARVVLSGADPLRTARLAGAEPPAGWRQEGPVVKVMLLLDGLPELPCWPGPDPWRGTIDIGFSPEELQVAAEDARAGRPAARPWIAAACPSAVDGSLAPEGRHVLSLFCQCFPSGADAEKAADAAVARFSEVCPGLPDRILERLALGPRELEERFGLTGGDVFHGEMLPGQVLEERPGPRSFAGVQGLYLAGAGAHPGGAVTGAPGYLAARAVLDDLATVTAL
jgi:phytoene dehydrogenase-like protein